MNFDFTPAEQALFQELENKLKAFVAERNPEDPDSGTLAVNVREGLTLLAQTSYLGLGLDPDAAGDGAARMAAMEILAEYAPSLFLAVEMSTRVWGRLIKTHGTDSQKERWLPLLRAGKLLGAVALGEASMNVENEPLKTVGLPEGDNVVISGRKNMVVNAPLADVFAVAGRLRDETVVFMVEKNASGLETGPRLATTGYEGAAMASLTLNQCRIPATQVIKAADPQRLLPDLRQWENLVLVAASLGLMKSSFTAARDFAKSHASGGRPVIAYQEVGFKLAEMLTLYQTARLLALRAGAPVNPRETDSLTCCAKVFCTEAAEKVAGEALRIMSAAGFLKGNPAERALRYAKYTQIAGTSTEISRMKIGDAALGVRG